MSETTSHSLYGGEVNIDFYTASHRAKLMPEGRWLQSVTRHTSIVDKSRPLMTWATNLARKSFGEYLESREGTPMLERSEVAAAVESAITEHQKKKDEAATNGTLVHAWAEAHARSVMLGEPRPPVSDDLPDQVIQGINAFLDWVSEAKVKFLATERMVYSKQYGYFGFADKVIEIGGKRYLGDYKTSGGIYPEMHFQVAAYRYAWEEELGPLDGHMIIRFGKDDGKFEVHEMQNYAEDFQAFLACKRLREAVTRLEAR